MPRQVLHTVLWLLLGIQAAFAQSFQKQYALAGGNLVIPYSVAQRPDGGFFMAHMTREDSSRLHVTSINANGDVLWSTRLRAHFNGDFANEGVKRTPILALSDGSCVVLVSKNLIDTGQGWTLVKLSPEGIVQWSREITGVGSVADLLAYAQGKIYVLARYWSFDNKPYMACLDEAGNVIWERNVQSNLDNLLATGIRVLPNQSILLTLSENSFLQQNAHIARLTATGALVDLLVLPNLFLMSADEHPDGRLFFLARTVDSISLKNQVLLGAAQNGQLQWVKAVNLPQDYYFSGAISFNASQDSLNVTFRGTFFESQRYWIRFDLNGNPGAAHYLSTAEVFGNDIIQTADGGFAWLSAVPVASSPSSFLLSKTNASGIVEGCTPGYLCQWSMRDTFFPTQPPGTWIQLPTTRIIPGQAIQQPRSLGSSDYCVPLPQLDASIITSDTVRCLGNPFVFKRLATTTGVSIWNFGGATPGTFIGAEPPKIIFPHAGFFSVQHILDQAGCRDTALLQIRVAVNPVLHLPADTVICPGSPVFIPVQAASDLIFAWNDGETSASRFFSETGRYILIASNPYGCTATDTIHIGALEWPATLSHRDTFFCKNSSINLSLDKSPGWQYSWADGYTDVEREISTSGTLQVRAISPGGCVLEDTVVVAERPRPEVKIRLQYPYDCGPQRLEASGTALGTFFWNTGALSSGIDAKESGLYSVRASDGLCDSTDAVQVEISACPECFVYIPTVFKPLSGTANSLFSVQSGCVLSDFQIKIYDRWGNQVFESRDVAAGWDGTLHGQPVPVGVYIFLVQARYLLGSEQYNFSKSGDVSVVR